MDDFALRKRYDQAQAEILALELMIEAKSRDLFLSQEALQRSVQFQDMILSTMASALLVTDAAGIVVEANEAALEALDCERAKILGESLSKFVELPDGPSAAPTHIHQRELNIRLADGSTAPSIFSSSTMRNIEGQIDGYVCVWVDMREMRNLELELRHAQKLESIGQMAAGVAHEINTPIQFVGDSLHFLQEAFEDLQGILRAYRDSRSVWGSETAHVALATEIEEVEEEADIEFISEGAPAAFQRAVNGLARVAEIVKAMRNFSHSGPDDFAPTNLNDAIETTLTLARNEYKYVAEVKVDLGEIPAFMGHVGDLGQVFLNLIVNAAHAIGEKAERSGTSDLGQISITTRVEGEWALTEVTDTGGGIPENVIDSIFVPFFTTKDAGKGTGQGL
jgi:two-component system NtrC family sensor kinase